MKKIKFLVSSAIILLFFSCNKSSSKPQKTSEGGEVQVMKKQFCHPQIPKLLAEIMVKDFRKNVLDQKIIDDSILIIDKNIYEGIINNFPNDSDTLTCTIAEDNPSINLSAKYPDLSLIKNKLLILFNYHRSNTDTKYHMIANGKDIVIEEFDAGMMHSLYNANTRSKLDVYAKNSGRNTMKIKIPKYCLQEYIKRASSNSDLKEFRFILGKIPHWDKTLIAYLQTKRDKGAGIPIIEVDRLKNRYVDNEGQITFITNAYDVNGKLIDNLSYYDLNSLCPQNCP